MLRIKKFKPAHSSRSRSRGFSLIELVIVVVIIGVVAAIAIPRLSRGASGASQSTMQANLTTLNKAVDLYAAEHGGQYPDPNQIVRQLTGYTDSQGNWVAQRDASHSFGPYLRQVPFMPVGPNKGASAIAAAAGPGVAWVYQASTGEIYANLFQNGNIPGTVLTELGMTQSEVDKITRPSTGGATAVDEGMSVTEP